MRHMKWWLPVIAALLSVGCGTDDPAPRHFDGPNAFQQAVGCEMAPAEDLPQFGSEITFYCWRDGAATYPDAEGLWFADADDMAAWERTGTSLAPDAEWPRLVGDRWAVDGASVADLRKLQELIGGSIHR